VSGFQQGQQLIHEVDVPGAFYFRDHDHIELVAYLADDLGDIIQKPGTVKGVDPGPQSGVAEVHTLCHLNETSPGRLFCLHGDSVF